MNVVALVGTLTRAPSVKFEGAGSQVTTFTLLVEEPGREGSTFRLFVPCVCWGKVADSASMLNGEDLISVVGKLCWRKQRDTHGQEKSALAVNVRDVAVLAAAAVSV